MRNNRSSGKAGGRRWRSAEERLELAELYLESGLTQQVFARKAGISVSSLQLWLRQASQRAALPERAEPMSLLEVELDRSPAIGLMRSDDHRPCRMLYEIELPWGGRLRLGAHFTETAVSRLLALLRKEVR